MDTLTIPRPSRLDKRFRLHVPSFGTTPAACIACGASIPDLAAWLNTECPADAENHSR